MAVTASGLYLLNFIDALDTSALALNLTGANMKIALFSNTITPNFDTDTAYAVAPYNANEVTGTGWSAGGVAIASPTLTISPAGTMMFDAADVSQGGCTFTGARAGLIYDNVLSPKSAIALVNFTADYSPSAGTFAITWAATGIFALDLTP